MSIKIENNKTVIIDATDQPIGRLASKVSTQLRGKLLPDYLPNKNPKIQVLIENFNKVMISKKKMESNIFYRHSGYPGGLKEITWKKLYLKDPKLLFFKVLSNMIPQNKLKKQFLKQVKFK